MSEIEEKMVFALIPDALGDGTALVMLGVPAGAWEHMKDGKTHTFDLTRVGVPVRLMLYGAADHDAAVKLIQDAMKESGLSYLDQRREDFSIKPRRSS